MTLSQEELVLLAKTQEKIRCEKILQNFMKRHKDDLAKVDAIGCIYGRVSHEAVNETPDALHPGCACGGFGIGGLGQLREHLRPLLGPPLLGEIGRAHV